MASKKRPGAGRRKRKPASSSSARINFIPNDPRTVADVPMRQVKPRPDRKGNLARFAFDGIGSSGRFAPDTIEFATWQSREAALAAVEAFEAIDGPLRQWAAAAAHPLPLLVDEGEDLNAYYDRRSLSFFHSPPRGGPIFSAASTDCVAHEVGHAILDSLRPDLWASDLPEHAAFHEAFGDCIAMLTAFNDSPTRESLLRRAPDLSQANFVEALLEDLANGVRRALGSSHPASAPRHSLNKFKWQLPSSLPRTGRPSVLTGEPHSFGRVFTGCFYDVIRNIFTSFPTLTSAGLLKASRTAGALLIAAARRAVESSRLFESVGVAMLAADIAENGGANQAAIMQAFAAHNINLSPPARAFQARARIAGGPGKSVRAPRTAAISTAAVTSEVRRRLGTTAGPTRVHEFPIAGERAVKVVSRRTVSLSGVAPELKNVYGGAPEPVVVSGVESTFAAARTAIPDSHTTEDEVRYFAGVLLAHGQIEAQKSSGGGGPFRRRAAAAVGPSARSARASSTRAPRELGLPTHVVVMKGGQRVLARVRFACGHCTHRTEGSG